jgi:hypothetical protein
MDISKGSSPPLFHLEPRTKTGLLREKGWVDQKRIKKLTIGSVESDMEEEIMDIAFGITRLSPQGDEILPFSEGES